MEEQVLTPGAAFCEQSVHHVLATALSLTAFIESSEGSKRRSVGIEPADLLAWSVVRALSVAL